MSGNLPTDRDLAAALRAARQAGSLTLEDFAQELGVKVGTISEWETSENEGPPSRGMKVVHYIAALLRRNLETRNTLLEALGAAQGIATEGDPELQRRLNLVRAAYQQDSPIVRSLLTSLEVALQEGGGPPAVERRHRSRPPGEASPPASDEGAVSRS